MRNASRLQCQELNGLKMIGEDSEADKGQAERPQAVMKEEVMIKEEEEEHDGFGAGPLLMSDVFDSDLR